MHMRLMGMSRLLDDDGSSAPRLCMPQRHFCRTNEVAPARNETASQHACACPAAIGQAISLLRGHRLL
jgi:hypothetical protein